MWNHHLDKCVFIKAKNSSISHFFFRPVPLRFQLPSRPSKTEEFEAFLEAKVSRGKNFKDKVGNLLFDEVGTQIIFSPTSLG